ncbi:MAG: GerAB/ArcD/ProY family transporter [Clostridia bacterium]|nr:GerAB/ArcD/ProY family transporter [Clostridia bacterium]
MKRISSRQLYFFLACIAPVGKLLFLPTQLANSARNDLLFPMLASYLVQAGAIFCVLLLAKRKMNLYELLENTFGGIAAKILISIFALFLFYATLVPLLEQRLFVQNVFYDTLPSLIVFAPYYIFAAYVISKPLSSHGRVWDILAPLSVFGFLGILVLSVGSADFGALLPIGAGGIRGFLRGTMSATNWFFDASIALTLLGKFDYGKGMAWKGALFYLAGGVGVLTFLATFYGIFQETALHQLFAFSQTSQYFSGVTVLGRIDYLFIFALALVMAFYCILPAQAGVDCLLQAYGKPRYLPTVFSVLVTGTLFIISLTLDYRFSEVLEVISGTMFWIFPIFTVMLPILCLLLRRKRREKA